jgi:drug/metabolite transporter (DMT)-like permease
VIAGSAFLLIKIGERSFEAGFLAWGRLAIASTALLLILLLRKGGKRLVRESLSGIRSRPLPALLLGASWFAVPLTLVNVSENYISSNLAGVLITAGPIIAALLALIVDRSERVRGKQLVGLIVGFIGVGMILGFETVHSLKEFLAAMLCIVAALSFAVAGFSTKLLYAKTPPLQITFTAALIGAILTIPVALVTLPTSAPRLDSIAALVTQGIIGTAILYSINNHLITKIGVGLAFIAVYIQPIFVLINGSVFLDEKITAATLGGVALILIGITLRSRPGVSPVIDKEQVPTATTGAIPMPTKRDEIRTGDTDGLDSEAA